MNVAVLMSTYNGGLYLREQIESILNQQCEAQLDLWVRDDGSTDDTIKILEEYAEKKKLHWYTGNNLKPAKSFLELLQVCPNNDYYVLADQDDFWYPNKVQQGIERIKNIRGPAISCANARLVDSVLQDLGRNVYRNPPHTDFYSVTCSGGILGCTMVFNDALAKLIQEKPMPKNVVMHDYYLCIVCALHDGVILYNHDACLDYRQHGNNVVGSSSNKWDALKNRIFGLIKKVPKTIDMMAASICENYPDAPNREKWEWLWEVSRYRESFWRAAKLALDRRPTYNSRNMELTLRLCILLRNR